jgi:hypothetical protein
LPPSQRTLLEGVDVVGLALDVGEAVLRVACDEFALQGRVGRQLIGMRTKELADSEVTNLLLAPGLADV